MSYTAAMLDFLQRNQSNEGILIIQSNGEWLHFPNGRAFHLPSYANAETEAAAALLEAAQDLDHLEST